MSADAEERKKLWESKDKDRDQKGDQYKTTRQDSNLVQMGNFARWMVERTGLEIREAEAKLRGNREEMNSIEDTIRALDSKESALLLVEDKEFTENSDILKVENYCYNIPILMEHSLVGDVKKVCFF